MSDFNRLGVVLCVTETCLHGSSCEPVSGRLAESVLMLCVMLSTCQWTTGRKRVDVMCHVVMLSTCQCVRRKCVGVASCCQFVSG